MKHLMIDLETMDNKPTAAITALAGVLFNPVTGEVGKRFYRRISLENSVALGGTMGAETVLWWMRQTAEARSEFLCDDCQDLDQALNDFYMFLSENADMHTLQVWGKGPSFDNVILRHTLNKCGHSFALWNFWNDRDVRTVEQIAKDLGLNLKSIITFDGVPHHALYDAIHQAKIVSYVWMYLIKIASVK